jgi:hydroxymethylpyrimidine/phosphomethylpyrimidine kinase
MRKIPCALTIAGSDSGGGAGIQADLKTFAALGVHGMSAITAVTAQNTVDVTAIQDISPDVISAQINAVWDDIGVDAAKTGMLHTVEIIKVVAEEIENKGFPTVVDPVMISKSGVPLLKEEAMNSLISLVLPIANVITPNALEAEKLSGIQIDSLEDAKQAAIKLAELGPKAVVVKGGHIFSEDSSIDVLYYNEEFVTVASERIDTKTTHGTGCSFAAAIAAEIAKGKDINDAFIVAKDLITEGIRHGLPLGKGYGPVNPMAHLYNEAERYYVLKDVQNALEKLEKNPKMIQLIPEVRSNLIMATSYAIDSKDVVGIPGRITVTKDGIKAVVCPNFGVSQHVANTILTAKRYDPLIRAGMNLRYSEEILKICKKLNFLVSFYDRKKEPQYIKKKEGHTTAWGAKQAIEAVGRVPDVIYHTGDWGKEPMITILGKSALAVAQKVLRISNNLP